MKALAAPIAFGVTFAAAGVTANTWLPAVAGAVYRLLAG